MTATGAEDMPVPESPTMHAAGGARVPGRKYLDWHREHIFVANEFR